MCNLRKNAAATFVTLDRAVRVPVTDTSATVLCGGVPMIGHTTAPLDSPWDC